jgi:hypothetical protein
MRVWFCSVLDRATAKHFALGLQLDMHLKSNRGDIITLHIRISRQRSGPSPATAANRVKHELNQVRWKGGCAAKRHSGRDELPLVRFRSYPRLAWIRLYNNARKFGRAGAHPYRPAPFHCLPTNSCLTSPLVKNSTSFGLVTTPSRSPF